MRIGGLPATDQARLPGNKVDVGAIANAPRFGLCQHALVDGGGVLLTLRSLPPGAQGDGFATSITESRKFNFTIVGLSAEFACADELR